jgi:large subunit ribosomal protein L18
MRPIHKPRNRTQRRYRRHLRVRKKVRGSAGRLRLVVFRSNKHMYAQLVDDEAGRTALGVSDRSEGLEIDGTGKVAAAFAVGKLLAVKAAKAGVSTKVVFDRGGYLYHGRVRAVAEGARKGGLEF